MGHWNIHYNKQGQPYIIQKNFGHDPKINEGSSHWTWHITPRGITYLTTGPFGKTQKMPRFINADQLAELKSYGMLTRVDGSIIDRNPLYPSEAKKQPSISPEKADLPPKKTAPKPRPSRPTVQHQSKPKPRPVQPAPKSSPGLWGWIKSLFGVD